MKTYIWIGPKRLVPKHGIIEEGDEITLDSIDAKSLFKQGLIKNLQKKSNQKIKDK